MPSKQSDSATSSNFAVLGVNHIGLAPKDPEKARWFFFQVLGLASLGEELVTEQATNTIMIKPFATPPNPVRERLELLVPTPAGTGPIAKFLDKRGSGAHHLALTVQNLEALIAHLLAKGVRMIDETPRGGAHKTRVAFVHPEATGGLLIELVEEG